MHVCADSLEIPARRETRWGLSPGPPACWVGAIPLSHVPPAKKPNTCNQKNRRAILPSAALACPNAKPTTEVHFLVLSRLIQQNLQHNVTGAWRNGSASDSRSEGWAPESLCPHFPFSAIAGLLTYDSCF